MKYRTERWANDGKYRVLDGDGSVVFTHTSEAVALARMDALQAPEPVPNELPPPHAALARVEAMQNELIALHVNVWGAYEIPRHGIDARVIHKPSGKVCVVRGFIAWTPPIVLYNLTYEAGGPCPALVPLSDLEAVGGSTPIGGANAKP